MAPQDKTVELDVAMSFGNIALGMSRQMLDDDVIEFVKLLDEKMATWDFTVKLGEYFAKKTREFHTELDGVDGQRASLAEVSEFVRQLTINPQVKIDPNFYTVWTDPQAQPAVLNIRTLEILVDLATVALKKLDADG